MAALAPRMLDQGHVDEMVASQLLPSDNTLEWDEYQIQEESHGAMQSRPEDEAERVERGNDVDAEMVQQQQQQQQPLFPVHHDGVQQHSRHRGSHTFNELSNDHSKHQMHATHDYHDWHNEFHPDLSNAAALSSHRQPYRQFEEQQHPLRLHISGPPLQEQNTASEQMQMLMVHQIMMQQMAAQQIQTYQMSSLIQQGHHQHPPVNQIQSIQGIQGGNRRPEQKRYKKRQKERATSIHVQNNNAPGRHPRRPHQIPPLRRPHHRNTPVMAPPIIISDSGAAATENWQEATIILCVVLIGLIYLVTSRGSGAEDKKEEKKPSAERSSAGSSSRPEGKSKA